MIRYHEAIALREQGTGVRAIARQLHLSRTTVRKLVRAGSFPEQAQRARQRSIVDPFRLYLKARWDEGCHNALALWRELQAQGFRGEYSAVYRYLIHRLSSGLPTRRKRAQQVTTIKTPSARRAMWLLLGDEAKHQPDEQAFVARLLNGCPEVTQARNLARQFMTIIRERQADALDDWMTTVNESRLPEMRGFVTGLRRDLSPVRAALTSEWSNGQVEGQVHRLKLIKRMMYGRAKFDLLRQRVLHAV
ncbi:MAG: transposase [Acidobacteria bacterium]|nr:transposase [Acidobacteriota bacterium]